MLYLLFRSDATNEKRGFNATHTTGKSSNAKLPPHIPQSNPRTNQYSSLVCGGRLPAIVNQNDLILSHPLFDGVNHYRRNEDCEWLIEANYNQKIKVEFNFFALEADSNCNYDQVVIYDGLDDSAAQLARLCGTDVSND